MGVIKFEGKIYYAKLMDVSGRPWWVSLHTRSFEVACKKYEKLTRLQRALRATLKVRKKVLYSPKTRRVRRLVQTSGI